MNLNSKISDQIIVALDGMNRNEAISLASKLPGLVWVKVGLELFISAGPEVITDLRKLGLKVFLDLKFHDIPATVAASCRKAAQTGAELITLHACCGVKALKEARIAASDGASLVGFPSPRLLAVTVLTSWDEETFKKELLFDQPLKSRVDWLAGLSASAGIDGCVCSPLEVKSLRSIFPKPFELVTPGIRPCGLGPGDQSRVLSPTEAIIEGASRIVVGRPVTKSDDPCAAFLDIYNQLAQI